MADMCTDRTVVMVTGGAGFIGAHLVRALLAVPGVTVVNLDRLTYAADRRRLQGLPEDRHIFVQGDIADSATVAGLLRAYRPAAIFHLAAETHVDRSIDGPADFIHTNIVGTHVLLDGTLDWWRQTDAAFQDRFRFIQVSTDEVYGALGPDAAPLTAEAPYRPTSPYAATKAAADHLARAWHKTYGLPVIITTGCNTYGPWQFPEKLIPLMIAKAWSGESLPLYGDGCHRRDWLHVDDHVSALVTVLRRGRPGRTYPVAGGAERANIDVVKAICADMDAARPENAPHERLIRFVADRPGHDLRYAMDAGVLRETMDWTASRPFDSGLRQTVRWYLDHDSWMRDIRQTRYAGQRLGEGRARCVGAAASGSSGQG